MNTKIEEDKEWVSEYYELPDEDENPARCGPWLLRIQLSNKVMTDKKLTVREVGERILGDFQRDIDCIFTDDNAEELVLRIRLLKEVQDVNAEPLPFDPLDDKEDKDYKFLRSIEANILKEMSLKGILGIKKVFMREDAWVGGWTHLPFKKNTTLEKGACWRVVVLIVVCLVHLFVLSDLGSRSVSSSISMFSFEALARGHAHASQKRQGQLCIQALIPRHSTS